ncbi:hypothetical protein [Mesomycoplasma lagogenitalium]|uniref:DUF4231 domain-containing protein n=1 Tax=Mesomycoplasma lagogenitalium TaxID=171286 RepID=A0ABY8LTV5_9BACT|nr:hypothetical protein [Mesomycoplasma lagogenitalium]WGI36669.1 hypothetical protein QEG99_00065 [Mesomycoplasma lagogenitalium]
MKKTDEKLINYMETKRKKLAREMLISSVSDKIIQWTLTILNLVIIALALTVVIIETNRFNNIPSEERKSFLDELGLTVVLASSIVLTFIFNLFLSVYKEVMKYKSYKKAMRKISYITYKLKEDKEYDSQEFEKDFQAILDEHLKKKNVSKRQLIKKFILRGGK